jgi:hypothetical protein
MIYLINIINATTTAINTFEFGQREVISVFTLVTNKGEYSIIIIKQCKEKENNCVGKRSMEYKQNKAFVSVCVFDVYCII